MRLPRRTTLDMPVARSSAANTVASLEPRRFAMWSRHAGSLNQGNCEGGYRSRARYLEAAFDLALQAVSCPTRHAAAEFTKATAKANPMRR
jgi:hypothetical protein